MVGYSEVINTMAAMVLFSLILLTANRMILLNSMHEVETEAEKIAINLAQDIIDEARMKDYSDGSDNNIGPDDGESGSCNSMKDLYNYNDFDDYDGCEFSSDAWGDAFKEDWGIDSFKITVGVKYVTEGPNSKYDFDEGTTLTDTGYKKMRVTVESEKYLTNSNNEPAPIYVEHLKKEP